MAKNGSTQGSVKILPREGLTFDDVLLMPRFTDFLREDVDLTTHLHPTIRLSLPILSSPMDTVTEDQMAIVMAKNGGLGIIHRNLTVDAQVGMVKKVKAQKLQVGAAVGVGNDFAERVEKLAKAGADLLVIDSGHGHTQFISDCITAIKKKFPKQVVMAGNIATAEGAKALAGAGADILRVGMGPGSICTTRIVTGMGVPQMTAIFEAVRGIGKAKVTIVADGGIRQMGDMAKALAAGAHCVMLGSMLAGHDETPGEIVTVEGKPFKQYRGMGSITAMKKGGAARYGQSMQVAEKKLIAEGVEGLVPTKGAATDFLYQAAGALRSAMYYTGCRTIQELHQNTHFLRITQASLQESHPHSIVITSTGASYLA